jgi:hypothetical protein
MFKVQVSINRDLDTVREDIRVENKTKQSTKQATQFASNLLFDYPIMAAFIQPGFRQW